MLIVTANTVLNQNDIHVGTLLLVLVSQNNEGEHVDIVKWISRFEEWNILYTF